MALQAYKQRRRQRRKSRDATVNLVSLMDIFTILVFFLLVNSLDVETLHASPTLKLPDSTAQQTPRPTLTIVVDEQNLLVEGRPIAAVAMVGADAEPLIAPLQAELRRLRANDADTPRDITIMGDKHIPYKILKKVMATCADANFLNVSLAVRQRAGQPG